MVKLLKLLPKYIIEGRTSIAYYGSGYILANICRVSSGW